MNRYGFINLYQENNKKRFKIINLHSSIHASSKIKSINIKNQKLIINDNKLERNKSFYEIYNLKSIKNAFYIALKYMDKLIICKYDYISHKCEQILTIEIGPNLNEIKYFYDPLSKKEYLFINFKQNLNIYLIKNEKEYKLVNEFKRKGYVGGFAPEEDFLPIYNFEIFYNQFNKTNYLIIYYIYRGSCIYVTNQFEILILWIIN